MKVGKFYRYIFVIILMLVCMFSANEILAFGPSSDEIYQGIDISEWQGEINFEEVKNSGIDIVYIKASEGED